MKICNTSGTTTVRFPLINSFLAAAVSLSLFGCGGSAGANETADGESESPANETITNSEDTDPASDQLPINTQNESDLASGSMLAPSSLVEEAQCNSGWLQTENNPDATCAATFGGLCFEDNDAACSCAQCEADMCTIRESFPTQIDCDYPTLELPND